MRSFLFVLPYLLYSLYFQIHYISYAEFFNELFCVDRQNGHLGEILPTKKKILREHDNTCNVCANCKLFNP